MTNIIMLLIAIFMGIMFFYNIVLRKEWIIDSIDIDESRIMKGIFSIIVILVHIPLLYQNRIQDLIGSFAYIGVTFFFLMSSYSLKYKMDQKKEHAKLFLTKKIIKLLIPMILVNIIFMIVNIAFDKNYKFDILSIIYINKWIYCLMILNVIQYGFQKLFSKNQRLCDICTIVLVITISLLTYFTNIKIMGLWPTESLGYVYGIILYNYIKKNNTKKIKIWRLIFVTILSIAMGYVYINTKTLYFFGDYAIRAALSFVIILTLYFLLKRVKISSKLGLFIGNVSYEVFIIHPFVINFLSKLNILNSGLFILLTIVSTIFLSFLVKKVADYIIKLIINSFSIKYTIDTKKILFFSIMVVLLISTIYTAYNFQNYIVYLVIYLITCALIFIYKKYNIISSNFLFIVYYSFTIGVSPIILLYYNVNYTYDYFIIVLLPLLFYGIGMIIGDCIEIRRKEKKKTKFKLLNFITYNNVLRILIIISYIASAYFIVKNINMYLAKDVYNGRIAAIQGLGVLVQLSQLSIIIVPLMYESYTKNKKGIKKIELVINFIISSVTLLATGFRAPLLLLLIILALMFIIKNRINYKKVLLIGIFLFAALFLLDALRGHSTLFKFKDGENMNSQNQILVNSKNLDVITTVFPKDVPYQKGYTYLINLKMLMPGPDLDYTLWLKEKLDMKFAGGGVTPTINGELYMNFGIYAIFIGFTLFGILGVVLDYLISKKNGGFIYIYLLAQYFHCISGGIANVMVPIMITLLVYVFVQLFNTEVGEKSE